MTEKLSLASLMTFRMRAAHPVVYMSFSPGSSVRASFCVRMPMTGRSLEMASSMWRTLFRRPTSMGMIEPGKRTEFRSGRMEMISGISTGPSGPFLLAIQVSLLFLQRMAASSFRQGDIFSTESQPAVGWRMRIKFLGAAQTVTGSMHLLSTEEGSVLVDCGMFQGRREESRAKNAALPVEALRAAALLLTHAHIDHSGS